MTGSTDHRKRRQLSYSLPGRISSRRRRFLITTAAMGTLTDVSQRQFRMRVRLEDFGNDGGKDLFVGLRR
jgi:hypothetical protein